MSLVDDARALHGDLVSLRHDLHRVPEIGLHLPRTQTAVLDALDGLDLQISTGTGCTSVTAVLRGTADVPDTDRRTVLLRGDMDALPVAEEVDVPFRSTHEGVMHACGHDLHTAMLVGAARVLAARRHELPGDVVLMFQPGEEGFDGAGVMLREGLLDAAGRRPDAAWALHVISALPHGAVTSRPGALLAASNELHVTVRGAGGHGSSPHLAKDPVPATAQMVTGLQTVLTRVVSPFAPAVLTVGHLEAGTKANVIPPDARFSATVRCFDDAVLDTLEEETVRYCRGVAAAHGLEADVRFQRQYPVTLNHEDAVTTAAATVQDVLGTDRWSPLPEPIMASEDFSRVLQAVPGAMLFLGASVDGEDWESSPFNHSPHAAFSDDVLADGTAVYAALALTTLADAPR